jgi:predicted transglutaminase-like cysteine proteinase
MRKVFLTFLFFWLCLDAQEYPSFSPSELKAIEKQDKRAKNRILNYEKSIQALQDKAKKEQLKTINFQLNRLLPQYDSVINKKEDNWATPKEFLQVGFGDCEDYVLIKYYSLIKLGFDEKKLFLTIVKENYYGGHHMVLSYFEKKETSPLILDNLSFKILTLEKRPDLSAELFINSQGVYKLNAKNKLIKVANRYKEFEALKKKIKQNF